MGRFRPERITVTWFALLAVLVVLGGTACGAASEPPPFAPLAMEPEAAMAVPAAPQEVELVAEIAPTPAPAAMAAADEYLAGSNGLAQIQSNAVAQQRIIVHTATMTLVVDHIQRSIDQIAGIAAERGGWVVSSERDQKHSGAISIRVPSEHLGPVVQRLRDLAGKVESEVITSQDVTDEYVDLQSRLVNERHTETALLNILEQADKVEDALRVQQELTAVQENIERLRGRIKFLEETSAFSLVTVTLTLAAGTMTVDAGDDQVVSVAEPARFRATFRPPEGIDQFQAKWDFGDGSDPVTVYRTAPARESGLRWTATVHRQYPDPNDSPYIVSVEIRGTGESGIAVGEDALTVTALEVPRVEVFPGESQTVRQGQEVKLAGSFTKPAGLENVRFQWDPGDGSVPLEVALETGATRAATTHVYRDFRPDPYRARLTIIADSAVGEIRESGEIFIRVLEEPGLIVGGLEVGRAFKDAIRAFSVVVQGLFIVGIWLLIFSPLWIIVGGVWLFLYRRRRRNRANRPPSEVGPQPTGASDPASPEDSTPGPG